MLPEPGTGRLAVLPEASPPGRLASPGGLASMLPEVCAAWRLAVLPEAHLVLATHLVLRRHVLLQLLLVAHLLVLELLEEPHLLLLLL